MQHLQWFQRINYDNNSEKGNKSLFRYVCNPHKHWEIIIQQSHLKLD